MVSSDQKKLDLVQIKADETAVLFYFSTNQCSVCAVLKPKVQHLIENKFPKIKFVSVSLHDYPLASAEFNIFSAPTIILFLEGKEYLRKSNNISLIELEKDIDRLYSVLFQ